MAENWTHHRCFFSVYAFHRRLLQTGPPLPEGTLFNVRLLISGACRQRIIGLRHTDAVHFLPWFQKYFELSDLHSPERAQHIIEALIQTRWPCFPDSDRGPLASSLVRSTLDIIRGVQGRAINQTEVEFRVVTMHDFLIVLGDGYDGVIEQSMEEEAHMVPTDEKCILTVMSGKRAWGGDEEQDEDGGLRAICMDEFVKGSEVVCMSCSHLFHGDCIEKWLRTSHYCPVCRYDMPTRS